MSLILQALLLSVIFINDCAGFLAKSRGGLLLGRIGSSTVEPRGLKPLNLWGKKKSPPPEPVRVPEPSPEGKKGISGLLQLIAFGAGAPLLGEFEKFDEKGTALFKLEANNLVDSKGETIQTRAKFFNEGWTEASEQAIKPPGFLENLLSGGRLMEEWDSKNRVTK